MVDTLKRIVRTDAHTIQVEEDSTTTICFARNVDCSVGSKPICASTMHTQAMEKHLLHLLYELNLSQEEIEALRSAIEQGDKMVEAALEVYRLEKDEVGACLSTCLLALVEPFGLSRNFAL